MTSAGLRYFLRLGKHVHRYELADVQDDEHDAAKLKEGGLPGPAHM